VHYSAHFDYAFVCAVAENLYKAPKTMKGDALVGGNEVSLHRINAPVMSWPHFLPEHEVPSLAVTRRSRTVNNSLVKLEGIPKW